jgi:putative DNA methylase
VSPPKWHSRGYIPHWEAGEVAQAITFRLGDSLPSSLLEQWRLDLASIAAEKIDLERRRRMEAALDRGHGSAALAQPEIADLVEQALLHFDAQRYRVHAWSIMPTHVHILMTPMGDWTLSAITHAWKSFTAKKANAMLGREGMFWAPDYFDRAIRDERHFDNALRYIDMNPVKAGLCRMPEDWRYGSAWRGRTAMSG